MFGPYRDYIESSKEVITLFVSDDDEENTIIIDETRAEVKASESKVSEFLAKQNELEEQLSKLKSEIKEMQTGGVQSSNHSPASQTVEWKSSVSQSIETLQNQIDDRKIVLHKIDRTARYIWVEGSDLRGRKEIGKVILSIPTMLGKVIRIELAAMVNAMKEEKLLLEARLVAIESIEARVNVQISTQVRKEVNDQVSKVSGEVSLIKTEVEKYKASSSEILQLIKRLEESRKNDAVLVEKLVMGFGLERSANL